MECAVCVPLTEVGVLRHVCVCFCVVAVFCLCCVCEREREKKKKEENGEEMVGVAGKKGCNFVEKRKTTSPFYYNNILLIKKYRKNFDEDNEDKDNCI